MGEMYNLGQIIVQGPVPYRTIKNIKVTERQNDHGRLWLHLVLDGAAPLDMSRLEQAPITVQTLDGVRVFCGVCVGYSAEQFGQYRELRLEAVTESYLADITPKSLTFQSESKTLQDILDQVLSPYGILMTLERNPTISQMIYQQNETDWAFAKRIANQFGLSLFVNGKTPGFQLNVGALPFAVHPVETLPSESVEKDIHALRVQQHTANPNLMAFEVAQYSGAMAELGLGVGHALEKDGRKYIIVSSEIAASFGVILNRIQCVSQAGALPEPAQAPVSNIAGGSGNTEHPQGPAPRLHSSNIISGQVLEVSGCDVKVQFDSGMGTRWIPYASPLSDCMYVMPDIGDTVFCYFENDGTFVCLGSKHIDNSRSDFSHPEEKVLTSKNRMIKFKGTELDITGSRSEMDGEGGGQLKIILSDENGVEVAATKDVLFYTAGKIFIQGMEQEPDNPAKTQTILDGQAEKAAQFQSTEKTGADYQVTHGGVPEDPSLVDAGVDALLDLTVGVFDELISPFRTVKSWFKAIGGGGSEATDNSIKIEEVEDKQLLIFGLNCCKLQVQDSYLMIDNLNIYVQSPVFHELGFYRGRTYERMEESTNTFMDNLLDGVQLALDIIGIIGVAVPVVGVVAGALNATISLMRGDYAGVATNLIGCIPGGSLLKLAQNAASSTQKLKAAASALKWFGKISDWIDSTQLVIGAKDALVSVGNFLEVAFSDASGQEKWDAFYDAASQVKDYIEPVRDLKNGTRDSQQSSDRKPEGTEHPKPEADNSDKDNDSSKATPQNANTVDPKKSESCGDPIDMVTGSQRMTNTDFIVKELGEDFRLVRTYESRYENKGGLLGSRWFLNIETRVWLEGEKAVVILPDMHLEHFTRTERGWSNDKTGTGVYRLTETEAGFCLMLVREKLRYQYDRRGYLSMMIDRNDNRIWFRYLGSTIQRMEFSCGQVLEFTYQDNKLACIKDILGRTVRYAYEGELLTEARLADEGTIHYAYTPEGWLSNVIDQNGHEYVRNEYDLTGRVTRQFLATGEEFVVLYDDANRTNTFQTVGKGDQTAFHYNKDKLVEKQVYPDGTTEEKRYDANQNIIWQKDRNGGELSRVYDEQSQLLEERLPNGLVTFFAYDGDGNLVRQWDNSGRETVYHYDRQGNRVEMRVRIEGERYGVYRFTYDTHGRLVELTDPNGNTLQYSYAGGLASPSGVTLPDGRRITYTYDAAGRCLSARNGAEERRYSYNNLDFMCLAVDPMGLCTSWEFDRLGNLIRFLLPNQYDHATDDRMGTRYYYDAMDKLIATVDSVGSVYATRQDSYGNVRKEINPNTYDRVTQDGEGIVYDHDAEDRRIRIRYPDGGVERIFYDPAGNIVKKVQPMDYDPKTDDGPGYTYEYDEVNRLVQITAPNGTVEKRYVYDLRGNIVKLIDAAGYLAGDSDEVRVGTLYRYNGAGWLMEKREPVKRSEAGEIQYRLTAYRYDPAGNLVEECRYRDFQSEASAAGPVLSIFFTYDRADRLIQVSDSTGAAVEYAYNSRNQRTIEKRKLAEGLYQVSHWKYDPAGRVVELARSMDRPDGSRRFAVSRYDYDKNGNVVKIQTPTGGQVLREYDAVDRLIAETHIDKAAGIHNRTEFSYDKAGNLVGITDNQGRKTRVEYDLLNREIRRTEKDGGVTRSFYDGNGNLSKVVRPNQYDPQADDGAGYQYTYDHQGRVLTVVGPNGHVLQTNTYDGDGRLLQQLDGLQTGAEFTYDFAGSRTRIQTSGGATQKLAYDARGNIVGVEDGNQNRTTYRLDDWGRIIGIVKADGSTEFYSYDFAGNMTSSTDGEGHTTRYEYGRDGQISAIVDPTGEKESYRYDGEGRLAARTDRSGVTVEFGYNLYGAPLFQKAKDSALGDFYEYTPEGLLKCAISAGMRYAYEYDAMGRMTRKSASGRTLLALEYDRNGNKIRQIDVTGKLTSFDYDCMGQLLRLADDGQELAAYTYNPDGTPKTVIHGPIRQEYAYDLDKNLTGLTVRSGGALLSHASYAYDGNGNRIRKQALDGTTLYQYDALNQLQRVDYPAYSEELFYNKAGNRARRLVGGEEELYQYDPRNRLMALTRGGVTTPFQYDNAGNLLVDDKARYSYDAFNRTTKVETFDGNIQLNRYDAEGLRYEMEENGNLVQFIFNQEREVVTEEDSTGLTRLIRGSELIARSSDSESARTYYHYASDEMGSTTHIVDEAGNVQNRYAYDAWGNLTVQEEAVPNRFTYYGQQIDPITQQYYLRARFYNPVIGRFTQEDTYRGDGLNLYAYCANNPVYYVDPSGFDKDALSTEVSANYTNRTNVQQFAFPSPPTILALPAPETQLALPGAVSDLPVEPGLSRPGLPDFIVNKKGDVFPVSAPDFVVTPNGNIIPIPVGAIGPIDVTNKSGKVTGFAYIGGADGANLQVDGIRIMDPVPARGHSPGYPYGYVKYENSSGQAVDFVTGRTGSREDTHIPLD